jgi:hypothetical protein
VSRADTVKIVTLTCGSDVTIDGFRENAVRNSPYDDPVGHLDLLVSEVIDFPGVLRAVNGPESPMPKRVPWSPPPVRADWLAHILPLRGRLSRSRRP